MQQAVDCCHLPPGKPSAWPGCVISCGQDHHTLPVSTPAPKMSLNNRQEVHGRAAAVLWSQTNLSGCQGRNSGRPPFPSSLSLCMETDLPLVICQRLKLISLAPCRPLLGNNIGFSFGLLGGRHRAGRKLCVLSPPCWSCAPASVLSSP